MVNKATKIEAAFPHMEVEEVAVIDPYGPGWQETIFERTDVGDLRRGPQQPADSSSAWLNEGRVCIRCVVCGQDDLEAPFTATTAHKWDFLGDACMLSRTHRCRACGEEAGAQNNRKQQTLRPASQPPDRCCHITSDGEPCRNLVIPGIDSQAKSKRRGDRRCTACAQKHAEDVRNEGANRKKGKGAAGAANGRRLAGLASPSDAR